MLKTVPAKDIACASVLSKYGLKSTAETLPDMFRVLPSNEIAWASVLSSKAETSILKLEPGEATVISMFSVPALYVPDVATPSAVPPPPNPSTCVCISSKASCTFVLVRFPAGVTLTSAAVWSSVPVSSFAST